MLIGDPYLANRGAESMVQPYVKWSYQPVRAVDVPAALIRAIATATLPPAGPVYLSIPLDDWDVEALPAPIPRVVSTRTAPDPEQLSLFASRIKQAQKFALVLGAEVDKSLGWKAAMGLAEQSNAPVFPSPLCERAVFPEKHELYKGPLPPARGPLSKKLEDFDLVLVVGAEVWRYYPFVAGPILATRTKLLQITNDPHDASTALVGDCLLSDAKLALEALGELLGVAQKPDRDDETYGHVSVKALADTSPKMQSSKITATDAFSAVASLRPVGAILVNESSSNVGDLLRAWPAVEPELYFMFASGGLGWGAPASVGIALAQKHTNGSRPTIAVIGDGSFHYSVQCIYTAVQQQAKVVFLIPANGSYAILKEFAVLEECPNVSALDLPGVDAVATAQSYGCRAVRAHTVQEVRECFKQALEADGPTLIEFPIEEQLRPLMAIPSS